MFKGKRKVDTFPALIFFPPKLCYNLSCLQYNLCRGTLIQVEKKKKKGYMTGKPVFKPDQFEP